MIKEFSVNLVLKVVKKGNVRKRINYRNLHKSVVKKKSQFFIFFCITHIPFSESARDFVTPGLSLPILSLVSNKDQEIHDQ